MGALLRAKAIAISQYPFRKCCVAHLPSLVLAVGAPVAHQEAYEGDIRATFPNHRGAPSRGRAAENAADRSRVVDTEDHGADRSIGLGGIIAAWTASTVSTSCSARRRSSPKRVGTSRLGWSRDLRTPSGSPYERAERRGRRRVEWDPLPRKTCEILSGVSQVLDHVHATTVAPGLFFLADRSARCVSPNAPHARRACRNASGPWKKGRISREKGRIVS